MVKRTISYIGKVKKLPKGRAFGDILVDHEDIGLAKFDEVAYKRAKPTSGHIKKGAKVRFKINGVGKAVGLLHIGKK
tara:strand:+ start:395 stop:625 length:231 start_codon:yes stop_codon:yes gene_type:complete